jgi:hypothetical protein
MANKTLFKSLIGKLMPTTDGSRPLIVRFTSPTLFLSS